MESIEPRRARRFLAVFAVLAAGVSVFDVWFSESLEVSGFANGFVWFLMGALCYRGVMFFPVSLRVRRAAGPAAESDHTEPAKSE